MKKILFPALFCLWLINANAQIIFQKVLVGSGNESAYSVEQTYDGGYIIAGTQLIKTDTLGTVQWSKEYEAILRSVVQTNDSGYVAVGTTNNQGPGDEDVFLIKTDASGTAQWSKTYGGSNLDDGYSIKQTFDGGYIIGGATESYGAGSTDVYLIKTAANGDTLWTRTFGGADTDEGYSVDQTADSGFVVAGYTRSFGVGQFGDAYLVKTDNDGDTLWTKTYNLTNNMSSCNSVQQSSDGGYILTGKADFGFLSVPFLLKTDSAGDTLWTKKGGGAPASNEEGESVQQTADGGYIVAVQTGGRALMIKTDAAGDTLWTKMYGGGASSTWIECVRQTSDGGYVFVGYIYMLGTRDVYLVKTDSNGNSGCGQHNPFFGLYDEPLISISGGGIIGTGAEINSPVISVIDPGIVTQDTCDNTPIGITEVIANEGIRVYPNPVKDEFTVEILNPPVGGQNDALVLKLFDVMGRLVRRFTVHGLRFTVDVSGLPDGIYLFLIANDKQTIAREKLMIVK